MKLRRGAWKNMGRAAPTLPVATPTVLLAQAHAAVDHKSGSSEAWPVLEACVTWTPPSTGEETVQVSELYAQLQCNGELVESGAVTQEASSSVLFRGRQLMQSLRAQGDEVAATWRAAQVEWARITHGVFQLNCKAVTDELQMSRRKEASGPPKPTPLAALLSLKRLDAPFR